MTEPTKKVFRYARFVEVAEMKQSERSVANSTTNFKKIVNLNLVKGDKRFQIYFIVSFLKGTLLRSVFSLLAYLSKPLFSKDLLT